ncbi:YraN family protein [Anaerococcus jeddahensis]|uniref:YraN family protein n=1 Tax=Anaerococcus jeddahensis TaxID=1673719 RepID=UPI0006726BCA|nr:YraN family protein [Anaerococcus jeddahensis]
MKSKKRSIGDFGEDIAKRYLEKKGYQILERNFLKPYGEIDIICIKDDILTFVEVKTRKNDQFKPGILDVDYYKQERIKKTAQVYIMEKDLGEFLISFDVCEVYLENKKIHYIKNAFGD